MYITVGLPCFFEEVCLDYLGFWPNIYSRLCRDKTPGWDYLHLLEGLQALAHIRPDELLARRFLASVIIFWNPQRNSRGKSMAIGISASTWPDCCITDA